MATAWPDLAFVKDFLRIEDTQWDNVIQADLAAAIAWTTVRVGANYTDPADPSFLPDPLFSVAFHEAGRLARRRDSVDGTMGWGDMGVVRIGPKDPDIETLIAPYLAIVT